MRSRSSGNSPRLCRVAAATIAASLLICSGLAGPAEARSVTYDLNIPSQSLNDALQALALASNHRLLYATELVDGVRAPELKGEFTAQEAVQKLLAGTSLVYEVTSDNLVMIRAREEPGGVPAHGATRGKDAAELEEVIVTGSNIRGTTSNASPVMTFDSDYFKRSGLATTEQLFRSLPLNFNGGITSASIGGISAGEGGGNNIGGGTGVNLRGLGNTSTLVLLNGRRLAPAGVGNFVDLSMIPLALVERVEILSDGASAIYGSDAVGGVVNILTRKQFDGAETRLRYGTVTRGGYEERQIGQTLGGTWQRGSALIGYDRSDNTALESSDREFTSTVPDRTDLIGGARRQSVMGYGTFDLTDRWALTGSALFSKRHSVTQNTIPEGNLNITRNDVRQYAYSFGATLDLARDWRAEASGTYSRNYNDSNTFFASMPAYDGSIVSQNDGRGADLKADGPLASLPGGDLKAAVGAHYRRETFYARGGLVTPGRLSRHVEAAFAEVLVPIIGAANTVPAAQALQLTLAARHEKYSDFGSTTNPKYGVLWTPASGLNVRATYGKSFRAPTFFERSEATFSTASALDVRDPANPASTVPAIFFFGNNPALGPERSSAWTAGLDLTLPALPALRLSATYFDIDFRDRIATPLQENPIDAVLTDPSFAPAVTRGPTLDTVAAIFARPGFLDFTANGTTPAEIVAIVDDRLSNLASRREQGLDFSADYAVDSPVGRLHAQLLGTWFFTIDDRVTTVSSPISVVSSAFFPIDVRARANFDWSRGGVAAALAVNYVNHYEDRRIGAPVDVASFTTVDLSFGYDASVPGAPPMLSGTRITLYALNLFNRPPPYVANFYGINFDPTNGNVLGRFLSVSLEKRW